MWLKTTCRLELDYTLPTPLILMLRARSGASQWIAEERFDFSEFVDVIEYTDQFDNLCQKLVAPADGYVLEVESVVNVPENLDTGEGAYFVSIPEIPLDVLPYLTPSRYCESDRMGAQAIEIAGFESAGYDQVANITDWIRRHITYAPGTSSEPCSATEILAAGEGVCKDLAHLGIAMCRSISIPARFVDGYLHGLEPMDLHAWFEAFVGGRWYAFDPTQPNIDGGRVSIAYGRDAADVAIYHQFGAPARYTDMQVTVEQVSRD